MTWGANWNWALTIGTEVEYSGSEMWQGYRPEHCDLYVNDLDTLEIKSETDKLRISKKINSHFKRRKRLLRIIYPCPHCCRLFASLFAILWIMICSCVIIVYASWFYSQHANDVYQDSQVSSSQGGSNTYTAKSNNDDDLIVTVELIEQLNNDSDNSNNNSNTVLWEDCSVIDLTGLIFNDSSSNNDTNLNSDIISIIDENDLGISGYDFEEYDYYTEKIMIDEMEKEDEKFTLIFAKALPFSFDLQLTPTQVWIISELVGIIEYLILFDPLYLLLYVIIDVWFKTCCMKYCSCITCICRYWCGNKKRHRKLKAFSLDVTTRTSPGSSHDDLMDENDDSKDNNDRDFTFGSSNSNSHGSSSTGHGGIVMDAEWADKKKDSIVLMAEYFVISKEYLSKDKPTPRVGSHL